MLKEQDIGLWGGGRRNLLDSWRDSEKKRRQKQNEIKVVSNMVYLGTQRRNGDERKGYVFNGDVQNKK